MEELTVGDRWRVELPELSALALRLQEGAPAELVGVGDRLFAIFTGDSHPPGAGAVSSDLREVVGNSDPGSASQWEGVAVDRAGCPFVLEEHAEEEEDPSHVFVLDAGLREPVCVIALVVEDDDEEWKESWTEHKNARAEALALLRDGHLLVAKQKDPVRLIEFGPRGAEPGGLAPSRFLDRDEPFEYPPGPAAEYVPLASWGLAGDDRDELQTVNDLAVFDRTLYAISRKSQCIVRLESDASPDEDSVRVEDRWRVPTDVLNPEGLAIVDELVPVVADDLSDDEDTGGPNIFVLGALEPH
jgi:hypothetical protein